MDGGRLLVVGEHHDMTFDEILLYGHSWLELSQSVDRVHLHIEESSYFSSKATVDFSQTKWVGIYPGENNTDTTLGNILYHQFIAVQGANINLVGEMKLASNVMESYGPRSKVIIEAANITLYSGAEVNAGYTLLSANETL